MRDAVQDGQTLQIRTESKVSSSVILLIRFISPIAFPGKKVSIFPIYVRNIWIWVIAKQAFWPANEEHFPLFAHCNAP
jgi:hypothetical protein